MISPRKAADRGRTRIDWLDSRHTFSFGDYYDPAQMGFRKLRRDAIEARAVRQQRVKQKQRGTLARLR